MELFKLDASKYNSFFRSSTDDLTNCSGSLPRGVDFEGSSSSRSPIPIPASRPHPRRKSLSSISVGSPKRLCSRSSSPLSILEHSPASSFLDGLLDGSEENQQASGGPSFDVAGCFDLDDEQPEAVVKSEAAYDENPSWHFGELGGKPTSTPPTQGRSARKSFTRKHAIKTAPEEAEESSSEGYTPHVYGSPPEQHTLTPATHTLHSESPENFKTYHLSVLNERKKYIRHFIPEDFLRPEPGHASGPFLHEPYVRILVGRKRNRGDILRRVKRVVLDVLYRRRTAQSNTQTNLDPSFKLEFEDGSCTPNGVYAIHGIEEYHGVKTDYYMRNTDASKEMDLTLVECSCGEKCVTTSIFLPMSYFVRSVIGSSNT